MRRHFTITLVAAAVMLTAGTRFAGAADEPDRGFVDKLRLGPVKDLPAERVKILETDAEEWCYVPSWHDLGALMKKDEALAKQLLEERAVKSIPWPAGEETEASFRQRGYRPYGPIVVREKATGKWRALGLSEHAWAAYPVEADPNDKDLIWVGCNDGPPDQHSDYGEREWDARPDAPLYFAEKPGGVALVNVRERTVRYFGPYMHLVNSRTYKLLFDTEAVWAWGTYPLGGEFNGVARYDRKTGRMTPILCPRRRPAEKWVRAEVEETPGEIVVKALARDGRTRQYELDPKTLAWSQEGDPVTDDAKDGDLFRARAEEVRKRHETARPASKLMEDVAAPVARRAHAFVSGRVQGVGFRAFVMQEAQRRELTGWVKNLEDGRVEAVIEGPGEKVAEVIEKMKRGPEAARVDKVEVADEKPTGEFKEFTVRMK